MVLVAAIGWRDLSNGARVDAWGQEREGGLMMERVSGLSVAIIPLGIISLTLPAFAEAPPNVSGWRGNWTGLYPKADPPVEWKRIPTGVTRGMTCQAARPAGDEKSGRPPDKGFVNEWLVIGPFAVPDSVADFDKEQIRGEAGLRPDEGEKVGELIWRRLEVERKLAFGPTEYEWVDMGKVLKVKLNQVCYAHSYLHCERAGKATVVVEHAFALKMWLNDEQVYRCPKTASALGNYVQISRHKKGLRNPHSPSFEMRFKKGWNRLLVKMASSNRGGWKVMRFAHRIRDAAPVGYEEKNIVWTTKLPERTNASPTIVGDRIFTVAEPDELFCLDKKTGKILWRRTNSLYDAIPEVEKKASPVLRDKVSPLAEQLLKTDDLDGIMALRSEIHKLLVGMDKQRFDVKWDGHMASHFGIVGFSTTPVSDGKNVCVFVGTGVVACYDLNGTRKWIRRIPLEQYVYTSSPAIADGKLVVNCAGIHAFGIETGEETWVNKEAVGGVASLIAPRIRGVEVVVTQKGDVLRASDGHLLRDHPRKRKGDTGWAPATIIGDVMHLPWSAFELIVDDFSEVQGEDWKPKMSSVGGITNNRTPDGKWIDRWTAAAPLIHDGIAYCIDIYGILYAVDLKAKKLLYRKKLDFDPLSSYVHLPVAVSPTLGGRHIYVMDNQGTCIVFRPGAVFQQVARNRLGTLVERQWPIPPQETTCYGSPVMEGRYMSVRGR